MFVIKRKYSNEYNEIYLNNGTEKSCFGMLPVRPLDERSLSNENINQLWCS